MQNGTHPTKRARLADQLRAKYKESNPKSEQAWQRACLYLPGGNTRSVLYHEPFPITFESGQGCYVKSLDGKEYVDFVSEYTAALFGHSHPDIQRAVSAAMSNGFNLGGHTKMEVELAEHLVQRFKSIELVRFCNSGTEANTLALGIAVNHTKRSKILVFKNGYHGGTLTFNHEVNPMNLPHEYVMGEYNDVDKTKQVVTSDIGAILVEPMLGAGGLTPATKRFLRFLRETATEIGAVLIFDEIITSRLHINGMQAHYDVYPDMTTLGKYVGGGFSFGAYGGRKDIMLQLDPRRGPAQGGLSASGTYNNNVFTMSAGIAASKLVTEQAIARLNALGDSLRDGFQAILTQKGVENIYLSGFGSLVGFRFTGHDANALQEAFYFHMLSRGFYLGIRGFMNLNFMHQEEHITQALDAIQDFVTSLVDE